MAYRQNDSQGRNDAVRYDLIERIGVLNVKDSGWTREVNIVSWNDGEAKVDIREWAPDHKRMTKGITLFESEAEKLTKMLARRYGLRISERNFASRASFRDENDRDIFRTDDRVMQPEASIPQSDHIPIADAAAACVAELTDSMTDTAASELR